MTREEKKKMMNEVLANTMADLQRRIAMRDDLNTHSMQVAAEYQDDLDDGSCPMCHKANCDHDDTDWLLSNPESAARLLKGIRQFEAGEVQAFTAADAPQELNERLAARLAQLEEQATRAARLQVLREVYEAARDVRPESDHWDATAWAENADKLFEDGFSHPSWDTHCHPMVEAARHYIIARDFGEWDRNKALMIWKQRNGGAL